MIYPMTLIERTDGAFLLSKGAIDLFLTREEASTLASMLYISFQLEMYQEKAKQAGASA
jgi:hypothetical protein